MEHSNLTQKSEIEILSSATRRNRRPKSNILADWILLYGAGMAAIALGIYALYIFTKGNWRAAESIAAAAKLLALIAVTYLVQTRWLR